MRHLTLIACAALLVFPASALGQDDEVKAAVAAGSQAWEAGWNAGDAAAIAALYAEDATVHPPGSEAVQGRAAIQAYWQADLDASEGATSTIETNEVQVYGDLAVEIGSFMSTAADGSHADHGKFIAVWKNVDGEWKIVHDIFNSSM
jgi:uncharacterized protein (TIGR02246 family)